MPSACHNENLLKFLHVKVFTVYLFLDTCYHLNESIWTYIPQKIRNRKKRIEITQSRENQFRETIL